MVVPHWPPVIHPRRDPRRVPHLKVEVLGNPLVSCFFSEPSQSNNQSSRLSVSFCPPIYTDQRTLGGELREQEPNLRYQLKRSFSEKVKSRNTFTSSRSHVTNSNRDFDELL